MKFNEFRPGQLVFRNCDPRSVWYGEYEVVKIFDLDDGNPIRRRESKVQVCADASIASSCPR